MHAHVLLNLFFKLRKRDKMRGLPRSSWIEPVIQEGMLDSIYHDTLKIAFLA